MQDYSGATLDLILRFCRLKVALRSRLGPERAVYGASPFEDPGVQHSHAPQTICVEAT